MTTTTINEVPVREREGAPVRDLATERGWRTTVTTTIGDYLTSLGLYVPRTRSVHWNPEIVHVEFQRAALDIGRNNIKRTMLRDVMRGGTVPPVCLAAMDEDGVMRRLIIDGLQRTHVETITLKTLLEIERGEAIEDSIAEQVEAIERMGQRCLTVDEFLARPFEFQLWRDLTASEVVRLFMILNAGQQKVSPRHLLEIMGQQLKALFRSWGIPILTERERRLSPGRRRPGDQPIEGVNVYRYEFLLNALLAYLGRDPHMRTASVLAASVDNAALTLPKTGEAIESRIMDISDDACREDLKWVLIDLNEAMKRKYAGVPAWENAVMQSDTFVFPLLAALGSARDFPPARPELDARKAWLLDTLLADDPDPLALAGEGPEQLGKILGGINSNIGRRRRVIVFHTFRRYFRQGPEREEYPLDWDLAQHD